MNTFVKTINPAFLSTEFLRSLNGIIGLTPKELEVFAKILDIHIGLVKSKKTKVPIDNSTTRKIVMRETNTSKENLSKYMKGFKLKGLIEGKGKTTQLNRALIPIVIGGKTVQVTMILKIKENDVQ